LNVPAWAHGIQATYLGSAVDLTSGSVVVAGTYSGSINVGCAATLDPLRTFFVAKYDAAGACVWANSYGGVPGRAALAVDGGGNIAIAGGVVGPVDFGGGSLAVYGAEDLFVAALAPDGKLVWAKTFGGSGSEGATSVTFINNGVAVAGDIDGTIDLGLGGNPYASDGVDGFLMLFTPAGALKGQPTWLNGPGAQRVAAIGASASHVFVAGDFATAVHINGTMKSTTTDGASFLLSFQQSDQAIGLEKYFDGMGSTVVGGLAVGTELAITGSLKDTIDFGGGALMSPGGGEALFLATFALNGDHHYSSAFGDGSGPTRGSGVALAPANIYLGGYFSGTIDLGNNNKPMSQGGTDLLVAKFCPGP
jgi:hypothetical protein